MQIYDLISPRARKDKTFWHNVGKAFSRDKGGYSLAFDSLPLPDAEGRVTVLMVEQRAKDTDEKPVKHVATDIEDSVPF